MGNLGAAVPRLSTGKSYSPGVARAVRGMPIGWPGRQPGAREKKRAQTESLAERRQNNQLCFRPPETMTITGQGSAPIYRCELSDSGREPDRAAGIRPGGLEHSVHADVSVTVPGVVLVGLFQHSGVTPDEILPGVQSVRATGSEWSTPPWRCLNDVAPLQVGVGGPVP